MNNVIVDSNLKKKKQKTKQQRITYYFFFRSCEHFGQNHLPFGFVVSPTQAKWNHSIGHYMRREKMKEMLFGTRRRARIAFGGHSHRGYRNQSFHRMKLDDTNSRSVHLDRRACRAHRSGAAYYAQLPLFWFPRFQPPSKWVVTE